MMDAIKSIKGVGSVQEFGSDYSMRIWLDPAKMQKLGVTLSEVTAAIRGQTFKQLLVQLVKILQMVNKHSSILLKLTVV